MEYLLKAAFKPKKTYSAYKDSGISYIGNIPEHWSVVKVNMEDLSEVNTVLLMYLRTFVKTSDNDLYTVVPSVEEQEEIISYLNKYMDKFGKIKSFIANDATVEKVKHYMKDMFKDVITGKIDIRSMG